METEVPISEISQLPTRTRKALLAEGFYTAQQLSQLHINDLDKIHQIGKKGRNAILDYCKQHSISFNNISYFSNRFDWDMERGLQRTMYFMIISRKYFGIR